MPKRYVSKKRFRKKSRFHKKKKSKFIKQVLKILSPPKSVAVTYTAGHSVDANEKHYMDIHSGSNPMLSVTTPQNLDWSFMSYNWMRYMLTDPDLGNATAITPVAESEVWIHKASRYTEITNICNSVIYIRVYKIYPKKDIADMFILNLINSIVTSSNLFPDTGTAGRNFIGVVGGTPSGTLYENSTLVYEDALTNPSIRRHIGAYLKIVPSKEVALQPQQCVKLFQKSKKMKLFNPRMHAAQALQYNHWKGYSQPILMSVTGMTARATAAGNPVAGTTNYVNAAPCSLHICVKDYMQYTPRTNYAPTTDVFRRDSGGYIAAPGANLVFEFSEANNAGVAIT